MYTAMELARGAGFLIVEVDVGGVNVVDLGDDCRLMELGPDARDAEIAAVALPYLELPASVSLGEIVL